MADFAQLKQEYQPAPDTIEKEGAQLNDLSLAGEQLSLKVTAVPEASKNASGTLLSLWIQFLSTSSTV